MTRIGSAITIAISSNYFIGQQTVCFPGSPPHRFRSTFRKIIRFFFGRFAFLWAQWDQLLSMHKCNSLSYLTPQNWRDAEITELPLRTVRQYWKTCKTQDIWSIYSRKGGDLSMFILRIGAQQKRQNILKLHAIYVIINNCKVYFSAQMQNWWTIHS